MNKKAIDVIRNVRPGNLNIVKTKEQEEESKKFERQGFDSRYRRKKQRKPI